jgi:hypothetical protein
MAELTGFERELAVALRRYAEQRMPVVPAPIAVVDALDRSGALRRPWLPPLPRSAQGTLRLVLVAALLAALLAATLLAGALLRPARATPLIIGTAYGLRISALDGSASRTIDPGYHRDPRWSPDGAWIAVWTDPVDPTVAELLRATDVAEVARFTAIEIAWSPAGSRGGPGLAALRSDGRIDVVRPGASPITIDTPVRASGGMAWSTSGDRLAWAAGAEIYVTTFHDGSVAGTALLTRVRRNAAVALATLPDDRLVAVVADCLGACVADLDLVRLDGVTPSHLGEVRADTRLSVDARGRRVLAVGVGSEAGELVAVTVDGSGSERITTGLAGAAGSIFRSRWVDGDRSVLVEATGAAARTSDLLLLASDGTGRPRRVAVDTQGGDARTGP